MHRIPCMNPLLALASSFLVLPLMAQQIPPKKDKPFPLLRFPVLGGKAGETKTLGDWKGKNVLLIQFASW